MIYLYIYMLKSYPFFINPLFSPEVTLWCSIPASWSRATIRLRLNCGRPFGEGVTFIISNSQLAGFYRDASAIYVEQPAQRYPNSYIGFKHKTLHRYSGKGQRTKLPGLGSTTSIIDFSFRSHVSFSRRQMCS